MGCHVAVSWYWDIVFILFASGDVSLGQDNLVFWYQQEQAQTKVCYERIKQKI